MKRCGTCGTTKPLDAFNRDRSQNDGLDKRCRDCATAHRKGMQDKNGDRYRATKNKRHADRMKNDPEYRERVRRIHREGQQRRRATPEGRRRMRQDARDAYARLKADPEAWADFLAKRRERMTEIRATDPQRYTDILEARRINRRLRRIENGEPVRWSKPKRTRKTVLAEPLLRMIGKRIIVESAKALAEEAGISDRVLRRITNGEQERMSVDTAEALCVALDVPYSLIYDEGEEDDE